MNKKPVRKPKYSPSTEQATAEDIDSLDFAPFEQVIAALEAKATGQWISGTMLQRILMDRYTADTRKMNRPWPEPGERKTAWCLSIGRMAEPKLHFYGWDIKQAVKAAWKELFK